MIFFFPFSIKWNHLRPVMEPNLLTVCVCVCVWPQRQRKELKRRRRSGPSRRRRWSRRRPSPRPHSQNQRRTKWNRSRPPSRHRSADKRMETRWKRTRENVLEARHKRIFLLCITVCPRHMVYNVSLLWRNLPNIFELFFFRRVVWRSRVSTGKQEQKCWRWVCYWRWRQK